MHQTKKLISGGKRWKWVIPLAKAIGRIISWAFGVRKALHVVREIVEEGTTDEHKKGWLIIKPKLLLSRLITLQILLHF